MRSLVAILCCFLVAGCGTERPVPRNHLATTEPVLASAEHWQALASDVADHLVAVQPQAQMIAIDMPPADSSFGVNFRELLITELFKRGYDIADEAPYHVAFDWHIVHHPALDNLQSKEFEAVGAAAGLYGLYRLVRDDLAPSAGVALGGIAAGGLIAGSWIADDVNSEVVITATVKEGPHIVHRQTDIYYLEVGEEPNFKGRDETPDNKPSITIPQKQEEGMGLTDVTHKADDYCKKQHARAVLVRRFLGENGVRYNEFSCVKDADLG
jgi:hypothetical protein